jgi:predicted nucleotide-binding protein
MARTKAPTEPLPPPELLKPRAELEAQLREQVTSAKAIAVRALRTTADLEQARKDRERWSSYNTELLLRSFSNRSVADDFNRSPGFGVARINPSVGEQIEGFRESLLSRLNRLESIIDRLPLIPEASGVQLSAQGPARQIKPRGRSVFIVHGHDEAARESVARFIEKIGLEVVILHEQPNQGRTILEKFEANSAVAYAVVLLTPDDAFQNSSGSLVYRARQNVIFELGYFFGSLGRERVAALYVPSVDLPTDVNGLVYIELDSKGAWRFHLAKELTAAGLPVDPAKLLQ